MTFFPTSLARSTSFFSFRIFITASPARQHTGFPPKVPPMPALSTESMISAFPVTAPRGKPAASDLAVTTISGSTPKCSKANIFPVRPNPVWISSTMNTIPWSLQIFCSFAEVFFGGNDEPPFPLNGLNDNRGDGFSCRVQVEELLLDEIGAIDRRRRGTSFRTSSGNSRHKGPGIFRA